MKITILIFVNFFGLFCELQGEKKSPDRPGKGKKSFFLYRNLYVTQNF